MKPEVLSEAALFIFCYSYGVGCDSSSSSGGILGQSYIVPPLWPKSFCRGIFSVGHVHTTSPGRTPGAILTTRSNHLIWLRSILRSIGSTQSISDDQASYPTSYPAECGHPSHKELQPHSFCPYPRLMATIETFAFWLSALFTTTGRTKVYNTAATQTIRLLLSCSMLPSLMNKTPRPLNSFSPQYLITPPFSDRGLWNPGMVLASLLLKGKHGWKGLASFPFWISMQWQLQLTSVAGIWEAFCWRGNHSFKTQPLRRQKRLCQWQVLAGVPLWCSASVPSTNTLFSTPILYLELMFRNANWSTSSMKPLPPPLNRKTEGWETRCRVQEGSTLTKSTLDIAECFV